jgi:hypothetical protein
MLMEMSTMVNGLTTKLKAKVLTAMQTEPFMKEHGLMINSMDKVLNHGQMAHDMKDNILKEKRKETVA